MSNYLKPQTPIEFNNNYIYPLTTVDQVITGNGERLNSLFKKTIKESVTLNAANWSDTKPYTQTITLTYSVDDYDIDANVAYGEGDNVALHAAAGCLSYIKKNYKKITFYCLKSKPNIDIPIEITGTCRNTIATVEDGVKLNFDVVGGAAEPTNPKENTIWVNTDVEITSWMFSIAEPTEPTIGMVWIYIDKSSQTEFNALKKNGIQVYPISAKQYVSDAWVDVTAKSYQNGEWADWYNGELFKAGNQYTDYTGGWSDSGYVYYSTSYVKNPPAIGETIKLVGNGTTSSGNSYTSIAGTQQPVDVTGKTILQVQVISSTGIVIMAFTNSAKNVHPTYAIASTSLKVGENNIPIPSGVTSVYIAFVVANSSTSPNNEVEISSVKLI